MLSLLLVLPFFWVSKVCFHLKEKYWIFGFQSFTYICSQTLFVVRCTQFCRTLFPEVFVFHNIYWRLFSLVCFWKNPNPTCYGAPRTRRPSAPRTNVNQTMRKRSLLSICRYVHAIITCKKNLQWHVHEVLFQDVPIANSNIISLCCKCEPKILHRTFDAWSALNSHESLKMPKPLSRDAKEQFVFNNDPIKTFINCNKRRF